MLAYLHEKYVYETSLHNNRNWQQMLKLRKNMSLVEDTIIGDGLALASKKKKQRDRNGRKTGF